MSIDMLCNAVSFFRGLAPRKNINKIKFREIARFKLNKDKHGNKNHDKSKLYF